jgi:catechol 2,3-dioxygenase-like lactoylglutathione lyase family enzyme
MVTGVGRVKGLRRITIAATDLSRSSTFYEEVLGFSARENGGDTAALDLGGRRHGELQLHRGDRDAMTQLTFEVANRDDLNDIVQRLGRENITVRVIDAASSLGDVYAVEVNDPDGNRIKLVVAEERGAIDYSQAAGKRLGHVVLWTPDIEKMEGFLGLIGMRVSDRTHLGMSFLRCNTDHHTIGLARSANGRSGMQHVAFDVGSEEIVDAERVRLAGSGVDCIWGLGRHGPGNNVFSYYLDPGKNVFEFYGDMERVTDLNPEAVRFWGAEHRGDISGRAGAPPETFRS